MMSTAPTIATDPAAVAETIASLAAQSIEATVTRRHTGDYVVRPVCQDVPRPAGSGPPRVTHLEAPRVDAAVGS